MRFFSVELEIRTYSLTDQNLKKWPINWLWRRNLSMKNTIRHFPRSSLQRNLVFTVFLMAFPIHGSHVLIKVKAIRLWIYDSHIFVPRREKGLPTFFSNTHPIFFYWTYVHIEIHTLDLEQCNAFRMHLSAFLPLNSN